MPSPPFSFDSASGEIHDGGIRYIMIRTDVLMGIGQALGSMPNFAAALEASVFTNVQKSFSAYQARGEISSADFFSRTAGFAANLGWGKWSLAHEADKSVSVIVEQSPFANGSGPSNVPVCGAISGVLRALFLVFEQEDVSVTETACAAQGSVCCHFNISALVK